jgi:hypothetical protein
MRRVTFPIKGQLDALEKSAGAVAYCRLNALAMAVRLVDVNRRELFEGIEALSRPPLFPGFWAVENQSAFREYHAELIRHLHNYLASVRTLVDHTRILARDGFAGEVLSAEYKKRVESTVATSPLVAFVHDLRNYTLHVGLPITSLRLTIKTGSTIGNVDCGLDLKLGELREWSKWSALSKAYLRTLSSNPPVLQLLAAYDSAVMDLQAWLSVELGKVHGASLKSYSDGMRDLLGAKPRPSV